MNDLDAKRELACRVIDNLGGSCAVARLCGGIKSQSVSGWRREGLPQARELFLRAVRPDAFRKQFVLKRK